MSKLLIVIPAHNEEANIVQVVEELTTDYPQYDYVVVNDGSRDKTAAICRARGYRLIDLPVNLGLAGAFQTGLRFAAENGSVLSPQPGKSSRTVAMPCAARSCASGAKWPSPARLPVKPWQSTASGISPLRASLPGSCTVA